MPQRTLYEVSALFHDDDIARRWVRWILDEHIADVVRAGAQSGRLLKLDDAPRTYIVQYEFASRDDLDAYLAKHAPRLRAEGANRFSPDDVTYARRTAAIVDR